MELLALQEYDNCQAEHIPGNDNIFIVDKSLSRLLAERLLAERMEDLHRSHRFSWYTGT